MRAAQEYIDLINRIESCNPGQSELMEAVRGEYRSCCGSAITEGFMDSKWNDIATKRMRAEKEAQRKTRDDEKEATRQKAYELNEKTSENISDFTDLAINDDAAIIDAMQSFITDCIRPSKQHENMKTVFPKSISDYLSPANDALLHLQYISDIYVPNETMSDKEITGAISGIYRFMKESIPSEELSQDQFAKMCINPVKAMEYFLNKLRACIETVSNLTPFDYNPNDRMTSPIGCVFAYIELIHRLTLNFIKPICVKLGPPVLMRHTELVD